MCVLAQSKFITIENIIIICFCLPENKNNLLSICKKNLFVRKKRVFYERKKGTYYEISGSHSLVCLL
jgi:hypothetical protein